MTFDQEINLEGLPFIAISCMWFSELSLHRKDSQWNCITRLPFFKRKLQVVKNVFDFVDTLIIGELVCHIHYHKRLSFSNMKYV